MEQVLADPAFVAIPSNQVNDSDAKGWRAPTISRFGVAIPSNQVNDSDESGREAQRGTIVGSQSLLIRSMIPTVVNGLAHRVDRIKSQSLLIRSMIPTLCILLCIYLCS